MIKVVCKPSIIDAPWTPSPLVSPVSSLQHHPHQFPQLTSLQLMEAPFTVAPNMTVITFPSPRLHWVMVNLGAESRKVITKVARRAHTGHTQGKHSPYAASTPLGLTRACSPSRIIIHCADVVRHTHLVFCLNC